MKRVWRANQPLGLRRCQMLALIDAHEPEPEGYKFCPLFVIEPIREPAGRNGAANVKSARMRRIHDPFEASRAKL